MEIEFTLQPEDLIHHANHVMVSFARMVQNRIEGGKWFWWVVLPLIVGEGLLLDKSGFGVPFVFIALMLAYFLRQKWYVRQYLIIRYSEEFAGDWLGQQRIILDSGCLMHVTGLTKTECLWNGVKEILHTPSHTYICLHNMGAFIVPRRIFKEQSAFQMFKAELDTKWRNGQQRKYNLI